MIAGEKTSEAGTFRCQKCGHVVRLNKGEELPKCTQCAHDLYDVVE
jgi:Zn finger protein HypA/HybF involved in hydrogenase expression